MPVTKNPYLVLIEYELDQMSRYIDLVEQSIQENKKRIELLYQKDIESIKDLEHLSFIDEEYSELYQEASDYFPKLLASTFIVTWYSFVEQKMLDLCEQLNKKTNFSLNTVPNSDKGIYRAKRLLNEINQYKIYNKHWQDLDFIRKVRNKLVHIGNHIGASLKTPIGKSVLYKVKDGPTIFLKIEPQIYNYLHKNNMLKEYGGSLEINPSTSYCRYLIDFAKELFTKLYLDLKPQLY